MCNERLVGALCMFTRSVRWVHCANDQEMGRKADDPFPWTPENAEYFEAAIGSFSWRAVLETLVSL
jgi:hypothetical protein